MRCRRGYLRVTRGVLRHAAAEDQQILVDDSRRGQHDGLPIRITVQITVQIDAPAVAECRDRFAGAGVERVHIAGDRSIDAPVVSTVAPVHQPAIRSLPPDARVERPQVLAGRRAQRERLVRRRHRVEHTIDHDRLRLQTARLAAVVEPRLFELLHVGAVDLVETRVANLLGAAAVRAPAAVGLGGAGGCWRARR